MDAELRDRLDDLFVTDSDNGKPNHLWINQKDGSFKEEAVPRGVAVNGMGQAQSGMGVGLADVDGDGLFDLFVTHIIDNKPENNAAWVADSTFTSLLGRMAIDTGRRVTWEEMLASEA